MNLFKTLIILCSWSSPLLCPSGVGDESRVRAWQDCTGTDICSYEPPSLELYYNVLYFMMYLSSSPIFSSYQSCEGGGWDWLCWYRGQLWWHQRVSNEYFSDLSCHLYFLFCNIILIYSQGCRLVWRTCPNMWSSSRLCMLRASGQSR